MLRKLVLAASVATSVVSAAQAQNTENEWITVMEEHFDDPSLSYWIPWVGDVTDKSGKVSYTYKPGNAFVAQGDAVFRGDVQDTFPFYQTGGIYYPRYFTYGRYSARVKMTNTPGVIPAFWLVSYGPACGEIDIFEATGLQKSDPRTINVQHYWFTNPADCSTAVADATLSAYTKLGSVDYSSNYHVFSAEWSPIHIAYSVDGVEFYRTTLNIPSVPMLVNLNTNLAPPTTTPGGINNRMTSNTVLPADFHVDWVKVEQLAPRTCPARGDHAGSLRRANGSCAAVRSVDYNGDGGGDVILYNPSSGSASVATGQLAPHAGLVTHSLTDAPSAPWATSAKLVSGDFDADGFSDLLVHGGDGSVRLHYGRPDARFTEHLPSRTAWNVGSQLMAGDFNGDGRSDVLILQDSGALEIRYGGSDRGLRFAPQSQRQVALGSRPHVGDFNGDGLDDLLLYGPNGEVDLFYGQATDGLRAEPGQHDQWRAGHTLKIADFNGDGYSDVLIYAADGATEIRYGQMNGGLRFAPSTADLWSTGHTLLTGDFNGDGRDDVVIYAANGHSEIRYGQASDGLRFSAQSVSSWSPGHHLLTNDFDGDGRTDILIQSANDDVEIRYGQATDGLLFSPASATRYNPGWRLHTGTR